MITVTVQIFRSHQP